MDPRKARRNRVFLPRRFAILATVLVALVAACGSAASTAPFDGGGGRAESGGGMPAATAAPAKSDGAAGPGEGEAPNPLPAQADRLIVRTGQLSIRVKDLDAALLDAARKIEALGGYVAASQRQGEDDHASAQVTYRIPAARWDDALAAVRAVSDKVLGEQTSSQEVTDQVVDLGARLVNLRATEAALQKIMDKATKIPDILEVQGQLASVREQIERLVAEKQSLEGAAALATLSVDFGLPPPVAVTQAQQGWDPAREADRAAATLVEMGQGAVNVGIWLTLVWLPMLIVLGFAALLVFVLARRLRTRPPAGTTPDLPVEAAAG